MRISIHAAREGGDEWADAVNGAAEIISIHAAREGGDSMLLWRPRNRMVFQSTPPVKAATSDLIPVYYYAKISIHAAREGGDLIGQLKNFALDISIHAAREGGDLTRRFSLPDGIQFQSTPPVKAATRGACMCVPPYKISIHAAREGGDM